MAMVPPSTGTRNNRRAVPGSASRGLTAVRAAWPRLDSYHVASLVLIAWAGGVVLADTWVGDFQLHVAAVRTLAGDPASPPDPMVGVGEGSPYYSPYILLAALLTRLTGVAPAAVLGIFGILNLALLLVALRRFVRCFSPVPAAATVALGAVLLLWGFNSPGWSGFPDLRSLAETLPYPSTVGFALMLLLWERLLRYRDRPGVAPLAAIAVLAATIVLVHPFTAVETAIGAVAIVLGARLPARGWLGLPAAALVATGLAALWPYASLADLAAGASALVAIHAPLRAALLDSGSLMCLYGLVALPALARRLRCDRRDPLVLMFVLAALVVAGALATRQHQYLRVIPVMMLPLQVAFGVFVGDRAVGPARARLGTAAAAVVLFLGGLTVTVAPLLGAASALPVGWLPPSLADELRPPTLGRDADRVRPHAPAGATVLTDEQRADRRLNLLGYYSVNPGWPNPWIGDEDVRAADRRRLLDSGTSPAERGEIARRYGARCVLVTRTPAVTGTEAIDGYPRVDAWGSGGALYCR